MYKNLKFKGDNYMTRHTPSNQFNKDIDKVFNHYRKYGDNYKSCLLYTSPSPRD